MKVSHLLLILTATFFLSACGGSDLSEVKEKAAAATKATLFWYPNEAVQWQETVKVAVPEGAALDTLRKPLSEGESKEYKCGYAGRLVLEGTDGASISLEFNLNDNCRHFSFLHKDELYTSPIREGVLKKLRSLIPGPADFKDLTFMIGKWRQEEQAGESFENWTAADDKMIGFAYSVADATGDTVFAEKLHIERRPDGLHYVADVPQNPLPVAFKLTRFATGQATFENPGHDFPQRIDYKLRNDTLQAIVSGIANGKAIRNDLNMVRVQ